MKRKSRRPSKKRSSRKSRKSRKSRRPSKSSKRRVKKSKRFGGYTINFTNRHETLQYVFGKKPVSPAEMTKKLWKFIKRKRLGRKN